MQATVPYKIIDTNPALTAILQRLQNAHSIALDLEMENQRHHYGLHVALIQISSAQGENYIIDPLAGLELAPLGQLLGDPKVELIVHDADFDRRACYQVYGWLLANVFDTKIAAQLCGLRQFGLASLLQSLLGIQTDKKFQKSNWLRRPLPKDALDYAARDTASLYAIKDILTRRLLELERMEWAREEFARAECSDLRENPIPLHYRIKNSALLSPRQLAILEALVGFRDTLAKSLNRPVHFIIRNEMLLEICKHPPSDRQAIAKIRGIHPILKREKFADGLLDAIQKGIAAKEDFHPLHQRKRRRSKPGYEERLKSMQQWRLETAQKLDIEPYLLLPNDLLQWWARQPGEPAPPETAGQLRNWQQKLLGEELKRRFPALQLP